MINRVIAGALSAFQALLIAAIGLAICLVPLTILWMARLDLGLEWVVFYRAAADVWLLGHGVHLTVTLDPALASSLGLAGVDAPFLLSLAPLAFALVTFALAMRLGRRTIEADSGLVGPISALITFALATVFIALSARHVAVMPTLWRSLTLPTLIFAVGLILGARGEMARSQGRVGALTRRISSWVGGLSESVRAWFWASMTGGAGIVLMLVAAGAAVLAVALVLNFASVIALYEGIQAGPGGGAVITLGELSYVPNFAVWVAAWFTGAGFALGQGSSISPAETTVGPLPSLPVFGLVPQGTVPGGYVWIALPVLCAFIVARLVRGRLDRSISAPERGRWIWGTAFGIAAVSAVVMGLVTWATQGSIGPGRMSDFGATPWVVALWLGGEAFIGAFVGLLAPGRQRR